MEGLIQKLHPQTTLSETTARKEVQTKAAVEEEDGARKEDGQTEKVPVF